MHITCSICSDLFTPACEVSITPCGHMFHFACVAQWLERSKSCPQCRTRSTDNSLHRVFFNISNVPSVLDTSTLENRVDSLTFELRLKNIELKNIKEECEAFKHKTQGLIKEVQSLTEKQSTCQSIICGLKEQNKMLQHENKTVIKVKNEYKELQNTVKKLQNLKMLIDGSADEVEDLLGNYNASEQSLRDLISFITFQKRELVNAKEKRNRLNKEFMSIDAKQRSAAKEIEKLNKKVSDLEETNRILNEDLEHTEESNKNLVKKCSDLEAAIQSPSEGSIQNKALRRLIHESPMPEIVKTLELTDPGESFTSSTEGTSVAKLSSVSMSTTPLGSRINKYTIFQKSRQGRLPTSVQNKFVPRNTEVFYDGHGGHSKLDVFPKPVQHCAFKKFKSCPSLPKTKSKLLAASSANSLTKYLVSDQENSS